MLLIWLPVTCLFLLVMCHLCQVWPCVFVSFACSCYLQGLLFMYAILIDEADAVCTSMQRAVLEAQHLLALSAWMCNGSERFLVASPGGHA